MPCRANAIIVTESPKSAKEAAGLDLVIYNDGWNGEIAIENAHALVASGVDVAIEFQRNEYAALVIADIFTVAGIPATAVRKADLLLLDLPAAGPVMQPRMTGVVRGCEERLRALPAGQVARSGWP